ncbi:Polysaccharide export protein [Sterolibacterium denitrificans]|uniref:Polysaccharide export protein n=1 Tax=Sterolibacterium denitrificans TaxID=157592 RepID=A0A7Z7MUK8_9PROT|nr:polysaccharide biosynthesis/export family protein [Sterolibacterium denitrificans]SMB22894.1 Polysaccharide export protein [Sterolibacterium denitrificans]
MRQQIFYGLGAALWLMASSVALAEETAPQNVAADVDKAADAAPASTPAPTPAPAQTFGQQVDEYRIGVHDLLEISVFQVPDLSRSVRVNSRGQITLPMIGAVQAGGLSAQELEDTLAAKLAENMLQDPQVSVFIKEYVSQRVIIEGEVRKTGSYPIQGRTTLLSALARAEGLGSLADENEIKIIRALPNGEKEIMVFDLEQIRNGRAEDPMIKGDDVVVVERSAGRSMLTRILDPIRGFVSYGTLR